MATHNHDHQDDSNLSEMELRARTLETFLVEKGYVEIAALDRIDSSRRRARCSLESGRSSLSGRYTGFSNSPYGS